jgi:hypothetical protein
MGRPFPSARGPIALQLDSQHFSCPSSSLDTIKHDQNPYRESSTSTSANASDDTSYPGSFQSCLDVVDGSSYLVGRATSCSSSSASKKEVGIPQSSFVTLLTKLRRFNALHNVHPAETFPLALACGAVLQQIIFVSVQGTTLHSVFSRSCRGLAMLTFPGMLPICCLLRIPHLTSGSYLSDRIHHFGLRHRSSNQSLQTRPVRPTRQVEHNNLYRRRIVHASSLLDADRCLAIPEDLFWRSHLVSHAIRSSDAGLPLGSCFSATDGSRYDQYPVDEDTGSGS